MSLMSSGSQFAEPTLGKRAIVCAGVYDAGMQAIPEQYQKEGGPTSRKQVILFYELNETSPDTGKRFCLPIFCNNTLTRQPATSKLLAHADALGGHVLTELEINEGVDLETFVGECVMGEIGRNKKGRVTIVGVESLQYPVKDSFTAEWEWTGQQGNVPNVVATMRERSLDSGVPF